MIIDKEHIYQKIKDLEIKLDASLKRTSKIGLAFLMCGLGVKLI
ncbi:MAG: hypothetical protein QW041_00180 [Candidatus Pacearchaeota archaeon]